MSRSEQIAAAVALRARGPTTSGASRAACSSRRSRSTSPRRRRSRAATSSSRSTARRCARPSRSCGRAIGGARARRRRAPAAPARRTRRSSEPSSTVAAPDDAKRAIIGISVSQDAKIELPLDVDIDLGDVGGPSAGLPFALEIVQELGNDVDRGYRIAATGELELDGSVGSIGGIKQKTIGVRRPERTSSSCRLGKTQRPRGAMQGACASSLWRVFEQALHALQTLPRK